MTESLQRKIRDARAAIQGYAKWKGTTSNERELILAIKLTVRRLDEMASGRVGSEEVRIAERVARSVLARPGDANRAYRSLDKAWNELGAAKQSLQKVLREDNPDNPEEIVEINQALEHMTWQVSGLKRTIGFVR